MIPELSNGDVCLLIVKNKICQQGIKVRGRSSIGRIAVALIAVLVVFSATTSAQAAWYDSNWQYRKVLTIDYTKVGATLSNFPVLVSLASDTDLAADAQDDGDDILFTSSDGTTKLDHEIELFNGTTNGQLVAWVKIPSLSNAADTDIYMYYGNGSATNQQNAAGVWDDGGSDYYKGVWHLNQSFSDSTSYGNNGTDNGTADFAGKIASGRYFDGSTNYIRVAHSASLLISDYLTVEAWVKPDVVNIWETIVSKMGGGAAEHLYFVLDDSGGSLFVGLDPIRINWDTAQAISTTSWQHVVLTYDGSYIRVYRNGSNVASSGPNSGTLSLGSNTQPLYIGFNEGWTNEVWNGKLDEVRISNTARPGTWISTEFNNQDDPGPGAGSFFKSLGSEEQSTATSIYRSVGTTATALASGGAGSTQAIEIQRGTADVPNTGTTQTAPRNFTAFGSLTSAFVLNKNNRFGSAGASALDATNRLVADLSLRIELTAADTITFTRLATGDAANYRADWESWEYVGAPGGPNEFIVRSRDTVTITAGNRTNTATLSNTPNDINKCIPFITGISNTNTGTASQGLTALAWISGTNTLNVERGGDQGNTVVQVVTVEFTGSNWRVGHGRTGDFDGVTGDTGTVTLYADADGQTTPFTLNNVNNAIIASAQFKGDDLSTGNNYAIADTYPAMYISSATQVSWVFSTDHDGTDNQIFVHVLENADMAVTPYTDTGNLAGDNNVIISTAGVTDLTNTAIFGTRVSSGTGSAFARGWMNYRLTSTTNAALWCTRSGNTIESRIEIAIMPQDSGGTNELVISGSTATFGTALGDNIGVGDVIQYDSDGNGSIDALAFIHGRTDAQTYTVKDKDGNVPTAVASDYDWEIYRAYTSLSNWESQTENANITEPVENDVNPSTDLASANTIMMVACYADGADTTAVTINGWTTGDDNYIKIYTPVSSSEVGVSQRHNGTWDDSKYRIESTSAPINIGASGVGAANVWIDGLQIYLSSVTGNGNSGILSYQTAQANHRISNNIIRSVTNNTYSYFGIYLYAAAASSEARIWNNIIYGFDGTNASGISNSDSDYTAYVYNNTVYDCTTGYGTSGTSIAKNNIAFNNGDDYAGTFSSASDYNLGEDAAFSGDDNYVQTTQTAAQMFVDPTGSPPDFHVLATSDARDAGTNLSGDANLAFTDDIDGGTRSGTWEIGADEYVCSPISFDAASVFPGTGANTNTISWSHTVAGSGSDRILVVGVSWRNAGNDTWTVSSVTYNSQSLTLIRKDEQFGDPPGSRSTAQYYLTDPPTGSAYTIQVNFSGTVYRALGGAVSLTGVDQSTPVDAENGVAGGTGNPSVTVTTNTDGAWVVDTLCIRVPSGTTSVSGGQTERWNRRNGDATIDGAGSTIGPKTPAGDVTMSWTTGTSEGYSISAVALKPVCIASSNQTPDDPTINDHNDGSTISDNTPTLGFTQSDPDTSEQVQYRIQIDDTDNTFSSLVVDYTSALMAEGATSFTVGQAEGSGTYTMGSASQTLADGDYFWRVMTTDDESAASGWTPATTGSSVAFTVDTSGSAVSFIGSGGITGTSFFFDIGTAGTDRLVVIIADDESRDIDLTGVSVDGKSCNPVATANNTQDATGNHQEMWYCDEDDLGASNGSVQVAITGGDAGWAIHTHLYTGVDQGGPTDSQIDNTSVTQNEILPAAVDIPANGLLVFGAANGQSGSYNDADWDTNPTEGTDDGLSPEIELTEVTDGPHPSSAILATAYWISDTGAQTNRLFRARGSVANNRGTGIVASWGEAVAGNQTPDDPTINDHNDGSATSDNTPTLGFTQSDPDASEQVKYRIQIDDTDNTFSSLVVDYNSALMAEGATSFTVGQAEGSGTYTVGSESQILADGDYFWRVMTTDDESAASGWTQATTGSSIAFTVDASTWCNTVSRLDVSWHTGLTGYTVPAGSNRVLVFVTALKHPSDDAPAITGVTYGGQSLQKAVGHKQTAASPNRMFGIDIWYLDETGIQAATGSDFVVSYSVAPSATFHSAATFANVDQNNPIGDTALNTSINDNPIEATANVFEGWMSVAGVVNWYYDAGDDYTWGNDWTETTEQEQGSVWLTMSTAEHAAAADGTDTASATYRSTQILTVVSLRSACAETTLYRSVGTTATALANGTGNALSISGSTATFGSGLSASIGVGDVIEYDSDGNSSIDALAFIHSRTDSQTYTVKDKDGGTPTAVTGDNDWAIYRAYTSLNNCVNSQTENPNITEPVENDVNPNKNLVSANIILNVACYADGADNAAVTITGWTTGADNYIKIYTPVSTSEVGVTQRHTGTWASGGYKLVAAELYNGVLDIRDNHVRVTGLRIENTASEGSGTNLMGIQSRPGSGAEVHLSQNIILATGTGTGDYKDCGISQYSSAGVLKAWNNIIYDFAAGFSSEWLTSGTVVLYNNTIINPAYIGIYPQGDAAVNFRLANNLIQGSSTWGNYYLSDLVGGADYSATNLSEDDTSPQSALRNKTVTFVGAADFHLDSSDTNAKDQGTDLSSDPDLAFSDDIDGNTRSGTWDIGADEYISGSNQTPADPTINDHNDGSWTGDNTPTLNFTQSDPDISEQVKYQIQIDATDNTFTNLVVDYTSDFMAEGAANFTIGQAEGTGTYTVGSQGQTLSDGNYYWRVKTIDDEAAESGFATANSGSIAFKVDATPPTAPGNLTLNSKDSSSITLNFGAQTTETNFDTYKIFYKEGSSGVAETDTQHTDANLGYIDYNSATTTTINSLSADTQYVINIWAYDLVGNKASATEMTVTTDAGSSCSSVVLNALYEGTTQIAASGYIATVDITDVDMSKSFLVFSAAVDDNRPQCTQIRGNLYDAGSGDIRIDFERYESTCPAADIRYYVAEFSSGVSVQRGTKTTLTSDTINVPLSPTVDTGKSFPLISGFVSSTIHNGNDFIEAEITANNNLQLRKNTGDGTAKVDWQVIEYGCSAVQKNTISSWATASTTDTLSPTVDLSKSWLIYSYKTDNGGDTTMAENMVRGRITANNELTFDRDGTGSTIDLTWYVVEFTDDTIVKYGTEDFAAGDSQENVTLSPSVNLASTMALGGIYMRGGKSTHDSDDNPGYGWFTFDLTADNTLQITRNASTGAAADVGWFVIEFTPSTALYRSVGTTATALENGSGNSLTISGSTATFGNALSNSIGVGDVIQYDSDGNSTIDAIAFIHGRTDSQTYTVKDKDGGAPTAVTGDNDWAIYRAYTSLANWENQIENSNITEPTEDDVNPSTNLVTADTIMMVACYADGVDSSVVTINGWTTDSNHYIKIYTPISAGEVGATQRHDGTWGGGGYSREVATTGEALFIEEENVRIEGLRLSVTASSGGPNPIRVAPAGTGTDVRISDCIIRGVLSGSVDSSEGIVISGSGTGMVKIWNNIVYDFNVGSEGSGLENYADNQTAYMYNNTVYNCITGIWRTAAGALVAKNNIAHTCGDDYYGLSAGSDSNLGEEANGGGTNYIQTTQTAAQMFVDPGGSPPDFHILSTSDAHDAGADLSSDTNLVLTDDIDGGTRSGTWDIGADEYGATSNSAPSAPTMPYSNDTSAQVGQTNPGGITDPTPAFSAIYNDPDGGDIANKFRVEVNTASDFTGTVMWDSGAGGTSMTNTTEGNRCPDIIYAGSALSNDTQYFWRITFWDDDNTEGTVSATQNFTTGTLQSETAAPWYNTDWPYRKHLRIDASRVAGDLSNFPVLISTTDADWIEDSQATPGHVAQTDGGDILFTASDGITKLDHEIETYNPATGELVAWVKVPTLSGSTDTSPLHLLRQHLPG